VSEFDEKLNALLSNPESMAQIMHLAQTLSGQSAPGSAQAGGQGSAPPSAGDAPSGPAQKAPAGQTNPSPQTSAPGNPSADSSAGLLSALSSLGSGIDPKLIAKLLPALQALGQESNGNAQQLLYALQPYLKEERREKVGRALQLARLIHIGKKFLSGGEG